MQTTASLEKQNNTIRVKGEMSFDTVMALLRQSQSLLSGKEEDLNLDLAEVSHADSSAIALLCEWRRCYPKLKYQNFPEHLQRVVQVSGLSGLV